MGRAVLALRQSIMQSGHAQASACPVTAALGPACSVAAGDGRAPALSQKRLQASVLQLAQPTSAAWALHPPAHSRGEPKYQVCRLIGFSGRAGRDGSDESAKFEAERHAGLGSFDPFWWLVGHGKDACTCGQSGQGVGS